MMIRLLSAPTRQCHASFARYVLATAVAFSLAVGCSMDAHAQTPSGTKIHAGAQSPHAGQALTARELSHRADIIAVGKVSDMRSEWDAGKTRIRTITTIEVEEVLKGSITTRSLTVVTPGGEVGEVGEMYSHTAKFRKEEEACVFLAPDVKGGHRIVGGERGKLTVTTDKRTGRRMVGDTRSLDDFKAQLSRYLEEEQSKK